MLDDYNADNVALLWLGLCIVTVVGNEALRFNAGQFAGGQSRLNFDRTSGAA